MKKLLLVFVLLLPLLSSGQFVPGSIAFTGLNADGNDNLHFVVLTRFPPTQRFISGTINGRIPATVGLRRTPGLYILQVTTPTMSRTVKILRH